MKAFLLTTAVAAILAACSDYDPGLSEEAVNLNEAEEQLINEYTANFIDRYGEIDENHTWGFGEMSTVDEQNTRLVNTNRNNWILRTEELAYDAEGNVMKDANGQDMKVVKWAINPYEFGENSENYEIPGFPSVVDGKYYVEEEGSPFNSLDEIIAKGYTAVHPIGDVTDEEIQYVSEWFRTHPNPDSSVPEFTEFFIQDISQDYDRVSYPNGSAVDLELQVYVDGTLDEDGYWFKGGTADNGTTTITFGMDYFAVQTSKFGWEHQNDFNAQKTNSINGTVPTNSTTFPERTLKYWTTNGGYTTSFMYYNSNQSQQYENYVLVHLTFTGPRTGLTYDGYYLAFDYQYRNQMQEYTDANGNTLYKYAQHKPDGYYSNWIVKLSPADPEFKDETPGNTYCRIMCEDLGNTNDFDFNDLVFDVYYTGEENNYTAHITLQAAGGTLPIYIGGFEAHEKLGKTMQANGTYLPINVGTGQTADPVSFEITGLTTTNPDDIVISVTNKNGSRTADDGNKITPLPESGKGTSMAPQKICIPDNTTKWTKESQQIEWAYPHFAGWVQAESGDYGFSGATPWNKTDVNTKYLY